MQIFQVLIARVWANKWRPCGAEMTIKPYKESVTWWKWKCINISREILRMNECNHYIMEYMCQTIYCVYRVLFALPVVAVHNIYRYILKTDKWVMASCAYQHHFRGFLNWPKNTHKLDLLNFGPALGPWAWLTLSFKHLTPRLCWSHVWCISLVIVLTWLLF